MPWVTGSTCWKMNRAGASLVSCCTGGVINVGLISPPPKQAADIMFLFSSLLCISFLLSECLCSCNKGRWWTLWACGGRKKSTLQLEYKYNDLKEVLLCRNYVVWSIRGPSPWFSWQDFGNICFEKWKNKDFPVFSWFKWWCLLKPNLFFLCSSICITRHVPQFLRGQRGAPESHQAAAPSGCRDWCSGVGHRQNRPHLPPAVHPPCPPAHAALTHPPFKVKATCVMPTYVRMFSSPDLPLTLPCL